MARPRTFEIPKVAEARFVAQLNKIAEHTVMIIETYADNPAECQHALIAYGELIKKWSAQAALEMLDEVKRNRKWVWQSIIPAKRAKDRYEISAKKRKQDALEAARKKRA